MMAPAPVVGLTLKGHGRDRTLKGHAATSRAALDETCIEPGEMYVAPSRPFKVRRLP